MFITWGPWVAFLIMAGLAFSQARTRTPSGTQAENNDFQLRQNFLLSQQLERLGRDYRTLERDYSRLAAWGYQVMRILARCAPTEPVPDMPLRNGDVPVALKMTDKEEVGLRGVLTDRLSEQDVATLAFDLQIPLPAGSKDKQIMAVLDHVRQRHRLPALLKWLHENRGDIDLSEAR